MNIKKKKALIPLFILAVVVIYLLITRFDDVVGEPLQWGSRLWSRNIDKADANAVWKLAQTYQNPPDARDDFDSDHVLTIEEGGVWNYAFINGAGKIWPPPEGHAGLIRIGQFDGASVLTLGVKHDPDFEEETENWSSKKPAPDKYNNSFLIGLGGYMPTPTEDIVYEGRMRIDPDFHGSTGLWMQEKGTFDKNGMGVKPFRSIGFGFVGSASAEYVRGLSFQYVLGLSIQDIKMIEGVDPYSWNVYQIRLGWKDANTQVATFYINGVKVGSLEVLPMGPMEAQVWGDNYKVFKTKITYLNIPIGHEQHTYYDYVRAFVVPHETQK